MTREHSSGSVMTYRGGSGGEAGARGHIYTYSCFTAENNTVKQLSSKYIYFFLSPLPHFLLPVLKLATITEAEQPGELYINKMTDC